MCPSPENVFLGQVNSFRMTCLSEWLATFYLCLAFESLVLLMFVFCYLVLIGYLQHLWEVKVATTMLTTNLALIFLQNISLAPYFQYPMWHGN